ncbi:MAG: DUF547 domain-containing protein [Actinomycetota bacterium]
MIAQPNPLSVAWSIARARRVKQPSPCGTSGIDSPELAEVLDRLRSRGVRSLVADGDALIGYRNRLEAVDPDALSRSGALAFWINLYNAGALSRAGEAFEQSVETVLRIPGAFDRPWASIAGERLSLNDIEHGKIRRFRDPRIHAALVCGSASCPTLRHEPFGEGLDAELEAQMRSFLANGGASFDPGAGTLRLSRVFLWYGGDFTRPRRMPTWLPARRHDIARSVARWLEPTQAEWVLTASPRVEFALYDWGLACSIA